MKSETGETPEAFYCCVKIAGTPSGRKKRFSSTVFHKGAACPVPEFRQEAPHFFRISKMVHRSLFITGAVDFHVLKSQEKELFPYLRLKPENPPQMNRFHFN